MKEALAEALDRTLHGLAKGFVLGLLFWGTLAAWLFLSPRTFKAALAWIGPWGFVGLVVFVVAVVVVLP